MVFSLLYLIFWIFVLCFLFPVLNRDLCLNCAIDFLKRNKDHVYDEDRWFMDVYIAHFQSFLPVTDISHCTDLGWVLKQYQGY